jgi:hypothetical protein
MEKRLEPFLAPAFDEVAATRAFFSEHTEAEIPRELNELAALQVIYMCVCVYSWVYLLP